MTMERNDLADYETAALRAEVDRRRVAEMEPTAPPVETAGGLKWTLNDPPHVPLRGRNTDPGEDLRAADAVIEDLQAGDAVGERSPLTAYEEGELREELVRRGYNVFDSLHGATLDALRREYNRRVENLARAGKPEPAPLESERE